MKRLKWMAGVSALAALLAVAPVVHGGGRWRGIDPELEVNGHRVNIVVAVPSGRWCAIDGPIKLDVLVPDVRDAFFVSESTGQRIPGRSFKSDSDYTRCGTFTLTTIGDQDMDENSIYVSGKVASANKKVKFPMDITISVDGVERATCSGKANQLIKCAPIALDR